MELARGFICWISNCAPAPGHWTKNQGNALISEGWEDLTQIHSRDRKAGGQVQRTDQLSALITCVQFNAFHYWAGTIQVTKPLMLKITSASAAWACVQSSAPHSRQELNIEPQFNSVGVWEPRESPVSSLCSSKMWCWQGEQLGAPVRPARGCRILLGTCTASMCSVRIWGFLNGLPFFSYGLCFSGYRKERYCEGWRGKQ